MWCSKSNGKLCLGNKTEDSEVCLDLILFSNHVSMVKVK